MLGISEGRGVVDMLGEECICSQILAGCVC